MGKRKDKEKGVIMSTKQEKQAKRVTIGTDPEFFLKDKEFGNYQSAIGIVKGTKEEPEDLPCGSKLQYDNVTLEFSTPPAENAEGMIEHIRQTFKEIKSTIPENFELVAESSAEFEPDQLMDDEARRFGCEPDFNAWDVMTNIPPDPDSTTLRSCGGHLHVGHMKGDGCEFLLDTFGKIHTIRIMDTFHGIMSVVLDNDNSAVRRRELYGKAGCHRPTSYGVEYRVLSNFWLKSPDLVKLMDSLIQDVLSYMKQHEYGFLTDLDSEFKLVNDIGGPEEIQRIINDSDVDQAKLTVDKYLSPYLSNDTKDLLQITLDKTDVNMEKEWEVS